MTRLVGSTRNLFRATQQLFLSEHGQLVFAVLLLILIPAALVFNTFSALRTAQDNMDVELQRKALLAEQVFHASTRDHLNDPAALQAILTSVQAAGDEVWGIDILRRDGENFTIVASAVPENVGRTIDDLNAVIAWHEGQAIAYQSASADRSTVGQSSEVDRSQRFWVVVNPITDDRGEKVALISMKFSSQVIDTLVRSSVTRATVILVSTIVIVVLLLGTNSRLFQYTILFRKLKEVDQMKDEFISIASHELRTPITGIRGYLEMVLDGSLGPIPETAKEPLRAVNKSAERLGVLVEDLLNVSRIEQGRIDLELQDVDPLPVIREVIAELAPMAAEKQLQLDYRGPDALPTLRVNRDRFKQVIVNLVGNGLKYTPKGSVTVEPEQRDATLRLKVADTGIGMAPKDLERLFTKFYRVQTEKTREISGTGLGLWITKQIVEKMSGAIEVESIEGVGSQFIVTFPLKPPAKRS